jgi:PIN domain nuclease of toxin-antitoxin system
MSQYVTDTHALYWHLMGSPRLSSRTKKIFKETDSGVHQILIPGIVLIEMVYLAEKGRINDTSVNKVLELLDNVGGSYDIAPLDKGTVQAIQQIPRTAVPDMPDRIITATALQLGLPLITRDEKIKDSEMVSVIW